MKGLGRKAETVLPLALVILAGSLAFTPATGGAQERPGRWAGPQRRAEERRDDHDRFEHRNMERRVAPWRFEHGHGWRFEHRAGVWSPFYAWWWVDHRVVLLAAPASTVVQYPTGRYELRGDGVSVPYYWVWIPVNPVIAAPALPPVGTPAPPDVVLPGPPPPPPAG